MSLTTVFRNAKIVTPQKIVEGDLVVKDGKIVKIVSSKNKDTKTPPNLPLSRGGAQEMDCKNLVILPGLIDTHVHFRDPGLTQKEDFQTGTEAAASGGVTTIFDMPNTNPSTISKKALKEKKKIAQEKAYVNYNFFVGLTDENFEEINALENIAGIKIYFGSSTGNLLVNKLEYLEKVLKETKHLLAIHAEVEEIIQENKKKFEGKKVTAEVHSKIRAREAEAEAMRTILELAKKNPQTRVHFCHISTKEGVALLEKYALKNVTAEVTMHHLFLNESAYLFLDNLVKVNPPLRTREDNLALMKALKKGVIQTIATDHAPHTKEEKEQDYWDAPSGMPMVELTLPLLLSELHRGAITLKEIVKWTAENPAKIFGIKNKGKIEVGYDADLVVLDLKKERIMENEKLFTKCKWTPFDGLSIPGNIVGTFVNGVKVFGNGKIVEKNGQEVLISA